MKPDRRNWDERFRNGEYPSEPEPSPLLQEQVDTWPEGHALDIATGTGRNAVFLATRGYRVHALDHSKEGLRIVRQRAQNRGVEDRIELIQADIGSHVFPPTTYDVITISFYRATDRFPGIKRALSSGGILFVQHHLRSNNPISGPRDNRHRFAANELLHACLDLNILHYDERTHRREDGRPSEIARIVARNSSGAIQSYPPNDCNEGDRTTDSGPQ